jgi:nanoRNase/pAp phosphatase (c-di-AMP/oligoRNAs hydrolase)
VKKVPIPNRRRKLRIVDSFLEAMISRKSFLMIGHQNPDEDCVASMVAFSLLIAKFNKQQAMVLNKENWDKFPYLLNICKYNSINIIGDREEIGSDFDTVIAFDTPKPTMVEFREQIEPLMIRDDIIVMEIDHHLEADGEYIGDEDYRLVDAASSTCELIGYLAVKLDKKKRFIREHRIGEIFTRNFVLSIVTGIVGDSKMGQFLKSRREKRYYRYFSRLFNKMLIRKTDKDSGNFQSIQDILNVLEKLSGEEESCYREFLKHKHMTGSMAWIALDESSSAPIFEKYDLEIVVTVAKYTANLLAEESGYVSLVAFFDPLSKSDLVQLRMRRSQSYKELDLREVIAHLGIRNGGGHEGAVGFRVPRGEIEDYPEFIKIIVNGTVELIEVDRPLP